MSNCNGFKLRGLNGDSNKVSVQSSVQATWMLMRSKFGLAKSYDVGIARDELVIIKGQESAEPELEIIPQGDPAGVLIAKRSRRGSQTLRCGQKYRFQLEKGETLILRTTDMRDPDGQRVAS